MTDDTAEQLTRSMSRGDEAAIETFYRGYFDLMYRHASRVTRRDEAFCLDVVQDAVLRVVRTIKPMSSRIHLENWLRLVVKTCALDRLRSEGRSRKREATIPAREATTPGMEEIEWLRTSLAQLDPGLVELIELRFVQGFTLARLAGMFRTTTSAIDGRLRRAIDRLRANWSDDEF